MKISKFFSWAIISAIVIDIALIVGYVKLKSEAPIYAEGQQFPAIIGIDLDGKRRNSLDSPCQVIRITADDCPFCEMDRPAFLQIVGAARDVNCDVVAFSPMAGGMERNSNTEIDQLKFISMDLGETLIPFITPQTIILDADRRVIWSWLGAIADRERKRALTAIHSIESPRVAGN